MDKRIDKHKKSFLVPSIEKILKFIFKHGFIPIISLAFSFLIVIPTTMNYEKLLTNNEQPLSYKLDPKASLVDENHSNFSIYTTNKFPGKQSSYSFVLTGFAQLYLGNLKSIYLIYSDFDQPYTSKNFHKVNFTYSYPTNDVLIKKALPWNFGGNLNDKMLSIINFHYLVEINRTNTGNFGTDAQPQEPIYILWIDSQNRSYCNVLTVKANPRTVSNVKPNTSQCSLNLFSSKQFFLPKLTFYSGQDILDAQSETKNINICDERFTRDIRIIKNIANDHFLS